MYHTADQGAVITLSMTSSLSFWTEALFMDKLITCTQWFLHYMALWLFRTKLLSLILLAWAGLSKVASCQGESPPTWLISASYSAWHFFKDGIFLNKTSLDWSLSLTTQRSTSKLSDNPAWVVNKSAKHSLSKTNKTVNEYSSGLPTDLHC